MIAELAFEMGVAPSALLAEPEFLEPLIHVYNEVGRREKNRQAQDQLKRALG